MLALPAALGVWGIWLSAPCAELVAFALTAACVICLRKRYGYWQRARAVRETERPDVTRGPESGPCPVPPRSKGLNRKQSFVLSCPAPLACFP